MPSPEPVVPAVPRLVVRGRTVDLRRPVLMGIINATPDSFSDGGGLRPMREQLALAHQLVADGATILDVGGQSGITGVPEVPAAEEIDRVAQLVAGIAQELPGTVISVDTYRPPVVEAVLDAGAHLVNDVSGLLHPEIADRCADVGAGLVVMHTRARPKHKVLDPNLYDDVVDDVVDFLASRVATATGRGLPADATVVDPGPDFAKTPHQTVTVLRHLDQVLALGRPVLLALSRKDFVGVITNKRPGDRLAGTLGAIAPFASLPGTIFRVHDVEAVATYLDTVAALTTDHAGTRFTA